VLYNPNPLSKYRLSVQAPLALLAISKILDKEGYDIRIISHCLYEDPVREALKQCENALCLGITCMTGYQITDGLNVAKLVRQKYPELPIVWGGWHPSMETKQTLESPYVDIIVRGQGERAFAELIHCLEEGRPLNETLGISYKENNEIINNPDRPLEDNLNGLPSLPYHLIDVKKCLYSTEYGSRTINYVSSYGCPFRCSFCEEQVVSKRRWWGLNAKKVADDVEWLIKNYGIDAVAFHDSNFFVDKERVKQFCEELINRNLKINWGNANGRSRQLLSFKDDLWKLMRESGLRLILTGAESGFQETLDFINKDLTVKETIDLAKKCHEYGIKVIFSFFVGVPWDSDYNKSEKLIKEEFEHTLELIDKLISMDRRHRIIISLFTPYPGSTLFYKSVECGFKPPRNFEDWGNFLLEQKTTPWITNDVAKKVEILTTYIFFFMDSDSYGWVSSRIKNRFIRLFFKIFFGIFERMAQARWKRRFFGFPIDYKLYSFARKHGAIFGISQS